LSRLWIGHYDGNERSRRVAEKCGFRYHHTEHGKTSLLGDIRTEHFLTLTAEEFMQK
jgi:RimJ/RimL family protein N-acetyltransferase